MRLGEAIVKFEEFEPACSWWNESEWGGDLGFYDGTIHGQAHLIHTGEGKWEPVGLDVIRAEGEKKCYLWVDSKFVETSWDTLSDSLDQAWKRHVDLQREVNVDDLLA